LLEWAELRLQQQLRRRDEIVVFFGELYKREKNRDTNLLEPMYSVEFDVIQGEIFGCGNHFSYAC
jgi:hypothetical protein